jgi:hypothetical protein
MDTIKRILAWITVVIAVIGILACLAGVIGSWAVNERLTNGILSLLSGVQVQLASIEDLLIRAGDHLQTTNEALQSIQEAASQLGTRIEENTPILDRITGVFNERLLPSINTVREIFRPIREGVVAVNNSLEALNALPGVDLPTLTNQLEALDQQIAEVALAVEQLQGNIADLRAGVVENVLVPFLERIEGITGTVTALLENVNAYIGQLDNLQAAVTNLQARIPGTIDLISFVLSIVFIWLALAQTSLVLVAWLYLRTGRLIWASNIGDQGAAPPVVEPEI